MAVVRVCFVCLGNICRSPTAEGVFLTLVARAGLAHAVSAESAGTAAYHVGEPPDPRTVAAGRARGYELPSRARRFERADFERFEYVVAMDKTNLTALTRLADSAALRAKLALLRNFESPSVDADVPDPYYGGAAGFEHVIDLCERACAGLLDHIVQQHPSLKSWRS